MFDARQAAEKTAAEHPPFEFIGLDGETYHLPHPLTLTTGQALKLNEAQKDGDEQAMLELFEMFDPDAAEAVRALPVDVTAKLVDAWYAAAGEPGKSPAPPSQTRSGAKRSKRT